MTMGMLAFWTLAHSSHYFRRSLPLVSRKQAATDLKITHLNYRCPTISN